MCGIFVMASCSRPLDRGAFDRALYALRRRGPDGRRVRVGEHAMLGHTRLAIVDIEGGAQPIDNEDGSVVLVFNGELYGHTELRRDLEKRGGHRFRTRCDAEIALHLYEELGPEKMLAELRGEFAFVIWDLPKKRVFAARDRFGIKPLLYAEVHGALHLSSNANAIFESRAVRPRWNMDALLHAMSMQYAPPDTTFFEGIRVLPPGHYLIADLLERSSTPSVHRYWDLDYPETPTLISMSDAADALHAALDDAVRVRLVADVPAAFQLSGGIDSSAVLGLGARALGEKAHAFTIAFEDGGAYDERAIAEEMAKHAGAELHLIAANAESLLRELPDAVRDGEGLAVNAHIAAKRILARAVRDAGFKVVLTGEGADEVLAGYAHLRCDLDGTRGQELALSNPMSAGLMMPAAVGDALDTQGVERALGFVPTWLRAKAGLGGQLHRLLTPEARARSQSLDAYTALASRFSLDQQLFGRGRVEQASYLWSKLALEGYILRTLGDGMEMAASIEGRVPFLDHRLFELVRTFPTELKIHEGIEKAVLRKAVAPVITERLRTRPKHPFLAPPLLATASPPALLFDVLGSDNALPDCFDRAAVQVLLDRTRHDGMSVADRTALEPVLMMLLSTSLLHTHFRLH